MVVVFSFKESSEDIEVFFFNKEIVFELGYFVSIDEINEVDLVRLLFFKDMERFISFRVGIEGFLFVSEVERDKLVVSLVVISILERVLELFLEEKDDYEIFVKVKDIYEKSKKNKNRDKGEKEKKRDFLLRFRSKRFKFFEYKLRKRISESRFRVRKRSFKFKFYRF